MKLSPNDKLIQDKMKAGVLTADGFLGSDKRNFRDIIAEDMKIVNTFDRSLHEIADRMQYLMEKSFLSYDGSIVVDKDYEVEYKSYRGVLLSPFPRAGRFGKATIKVTNMKNNMSVVWTPLHVHFIRDYGFFEGKGSRFRIEPEMLYKAIFD
jgi:hypothetical protein